MAKRLRFDESARLQDAMSAWEWKVGDRVKWISNPDERGTVTEVGYNAVKIKWDDGVISIHDFKPAAERSVAQLIKLVDAVCPDCGERLDAKHAERGGQCPRTGDVEDDDIKF